MIYFIIYVFAISFQVSGALLLLFYGISTKRDSIIRRFAGKGIITQENEKIDYNNEAYKQEFKNAYMNKLSFFYIATGYLLGVWGKVDEKCRLYAFLAIILLIIIIISLSNIIISKIIKRSKKVNKQIEIEDLKRLGIDPDIGVTTSEEIGKLFD